MPKDEKKRGAADGDDVEEDYDANRATIEALCRQSPNDTCNDCGSAGTRWVSVNHGVFVCIRCSGVHRSIGSHVTKVKSTNLDKWTTAEIGVMRGIGNARGKQLYEARFPKGQRPLRGDEPDNVVKSFIIQKYEAKAFADEEWMATLKRVYKAAGYKSGLKALKAAPPTASASNEGDFWDHSAAAAGDADKKGDKKGKKDKKEKKEKKEKSIYGAFGLVTVPLAEHDAARTRLLAHFGVASPMGEPHNEFEAANAAADAVAAE
jgi:hypothetical protein